MYTYCTGHDQHNMVYSLTCTSYRSVDIPMVATLQRQMQGLFLSRTGNVHYPHTGPNTQQNVNEEGDTERGKL